MRKASGIGEILGTNRKRERGKKEGCEKGIKKKRGCRERLPTIHVHLLLLSKQSASLLYLCSQSALDILGSQHSISGGRFEPAFTHVLGWKCVLLLIGRCASSRIVVCGERSRLSYYLLYQTMTLSKVLHNV